jgi:hypothetical protein
MSGFVMVKRELLEDLLDSARLEADQRVASYGEDYRPHVLVTLRKMVTDAEAVLAQEAGKVEPVAEVDRHYQGYLKWTARGQLESPRLPDGTLLYTFPPAPVSVVLPERRKPTCTGSISDFTTFEEARREVTP